MGGGEDQEVRDDRAPRITSQGQTPREQLQPPTIHESGAQNLVDAGYLVQSRVGHCIWTKILESAAGFIIREAGRERDLLHKNVRSNSVIHMVCALRVRFGPPALNVANYPEDSTVPFGKKLVPICLSSAGPRATGPWCS